MSSGTKWQSELMHCGCATEPDAAEVCLCGCCCHACLYGKTVRALSTDRPTVFPPCSCDVDCDQCVSLWFIDVCTLGVLDGLVPLGPIDSFTFKTFRLGAAAPRVWSKFLSGFTAERTFYIRLAATPSISLR